jgi:hypothetical protein
VLRAKLLSAHVGNPDEERGHGADCAQLVALADEGTDLAFVMDERLEARGALLLGERVECEHELVCGARLVEVPKDFWRDNVARAKQILRTGRPRNGHIGNARR